MLPPSPTLRRRSGLYSVERALREAGLGPVAGADEAGRGACAGPLVVAAAVLGEGRRDRIPGLADSKLLTPAQRQEVEVEVRRRAVAYSVVVIPPEEVDRRGVHAANLDGMRRALARLPLRPGYALTDGFAVPGSSVPALGVWRGDRVAACVAAASVLAKVARDALMCELDSTLPEYGFATHKGYSTKEHMAALVEHGPTAHHRMSFANVARLLRRGHLIEQGSDEERDVGQTEPEPDRLLEVG